LKTLGFQIKIGSLINYTLWLATGLLISRLWIWIERKYHQTPHASLVNGQTLPHQTPLERFQQDMVKIQPLGEMANRLDDYFYHRIKRKIKKDATLSYEGKRYEVPFELVGETVFLVIDAPATIAKYVESLEHQWLGPVHLLDKQANNTRTRHRTPAPANVTTQKLSLVEALYKKSQKQFDTTA
jgi:putative transposase